jgi:methylthioribose-1-phosphate isomerase
LQRTVDYKDGKVILIDQTCIPAELVTVELSDFESIAEAIMTMKVRGAPAIGVTGALGIAVAARQSSATDPKVLYEELEHAGNVLKNTRPTAVNLFWGIDRMLDAAQAVMQVGSSIDDMVDALESLGELMLQEDEDVCRMIGKHGAELLPDKGNLLTHCNAGALACVGYGTALGVIRAAVEAGKQIHVYADETRPRLQGMKLTCFELLSDNIPVTVISDNMAGWFMRQGRIDCVVVGADCIASNGDVANKIGTYSVAVLAHHHKIPFYVAAPLSTVDFSLASGDEIPIEERPHDEVTHIDGHRVAPKGVEVVNPSFDVTPAQYVKAIITEKGIIRPPYKKNLR